MLMPRHAIGVFDSGIGGLTVLRHIRLQLPHENLIYFADSANAPYGHRSKDWIQNRILEIADDLLARQVKCLVIACNTATAVGVDLLRKEYPTIPIIGMEPALKPAVSATQTGIVGVLATSGTIESVRFSGLLGQYEGKTHFVTEACHGLVACIERGEIDQEQTQALVDQYVKPLLLAGVDVIVLGCTHYPLIAPLIEKTIRQFFQDKGKTPYPVHLIETGSAVAQRVVSQLKGLHLLNLQNNDGDLEFIPPTGIVLKIWELLNRPVLF